MQITLNEYTLALLCGGISCLTYLLTSTFTSSSKTVRIQDEGSKKKNRKTILKSNNSETNDSVDEEEDEADDDQASGSEKMLTRRQSYNRLKQRRADSIVKSDHVIFADEITADDEKYSPAHDEIPDDMVEGILSKSEDEGPLAVNLNVTEVEALNHFDEIHPLDDHDLLLRRRSLHSTPSGSHRGSKTNLASDLDIVDEEGREENYLKAELASYKARLSLLENEISDIEGTVKNEKQELEEILHEAGLDKADLATSVKEMHLLLQAAITQLHPELGSNNGNSDLLDNYVAKHFNAN